MTDCPRHNQPLNVPTYKGKRECPACVQEVQDRLTRLLEKPK